MTSAVSKDDIEGEIWKFAQQAGAAGGRVELHTITRLLKIIDQYAIFAGRKYASPEWEMPEPEPDPFSYLAPGQFDLEAGVGRCLQCECIRKVGSFNKDTGKPYGHRKRCRSCRSVKPKKAADFKITCRQCGHYKDADDFYHDARSVNGYAVRCKDCAEGRKTCMVCRERVQSFPSLSDHRDICGECRLNRKEDVLMFLAKYKCRTCHERKFIEFFPDVKKTRPQSNFSCLECNGK